MKNNIDRLLKFVYSFFLCQGAGVVGSLFTANSVKNWYSLLNKPGFNPPSWVFAPVWTILYALMAISLGIVWNRGIKSKYEKIAFTVFLIHLGLNALWSILFFGLQNPLLAFIEIIILWLSIILVIVLFWKISRTSSILLLPYLLWVTFASILNFSIFTLNR